MVNGITICHVTTKAMVHQAQSMHPAGTAQELVQVHDGSGKANKDKWLRIGSGVVGVHENKRGQPATGTSDFAFSFAPKEAGDIVKAHLQWTVAIYKEFGMDLQALTCCHISDAAEAFRNHARKCTGWSLEIGL